VDYFLGDPHLPAPGTESLFRETVWRLPRSLACYRQRERPEEVPLAPAPCLERGYVTFGCFNNPAKITRHVVRVWSAILAAVPGSRLLLKFETFDAEAACQSYRAWFLEDGIDPARIGFQGRSPHAEYLAAHNGMDVALDPFPYNGGTSTANALWMGVPVVALAGQSPIQRTCVSLLSAAGLRDLAVETEAQYVNTSIHVAGMVARLRSLRAEIRAAWLESSWMDETGFTRDLERAYRSMWRRWCAGRQAEPAR
jgi:predicted O-linked N-acetylglucosamine transferase (SPINDLY family)